MLKASARIWPTAGVFVTPPESTISVRGKPWLSSSSLPIFRLKIVARSIALATLPGVAFMSLSPITQAVPPRDTPRPGSSSMKGRASRPPQSSGAASKLGITAVKASPRPVPLTLPFTLPNISTTMFIAVVPFRSQTMLIGLPSGAQKWSTAREMP